MKEVIVKLKMTHIDEPRMICLRGEGSGSRRGFGGGFRAHKPYVTTAKVQKMFEKFMKVTIEP